MTFAIKGGGISIAIVVQVLEINFGPPTAIFGSICSSKKRVNLDIFNNKNLFCVSTPPSLKLTMIVLLIAPQFVWSPQFLLLLVF